MKKESDKQSPDEWKIIVARNFEEIEAIRPIWEQMQRDKPRPAPDADIDRYLSVIKAIGDDVQPYVMLLEHNNCPAAMIICRLEKHQLMLKLGYRALFKPRLRCLTVVYGGILGQPEGGLCSLLVSELMKQLRYHEVDVTYFNRLRTDTAFYQAVRRIPGFLIRGSSPEVEDHWHMSVPDNMDQFYSARSHKHRGNLRRAIRKFEQDYPGKSMFSTYTSESDVGEFIRVAADISSKTYQHTLGVGIVNDERTRCLMTAAASKGWFRGHILHAGDKTCAFQLGLCYEKAYYLVSIGYDPAFRSYWPGRILFLKVLESICDDSSIDMIDFYFGDASYKKSYGTGHWPEACAYIFAPRLHLIFINMLRSSTMCVNSGLEYVVSKVGAGDWVKRKWRSLLRPKSSTGKI
ncbi:MAG: GNAT family N-acetyltransferase [Sedimentisphaerales bacterium]